MPNPSTIAMEEEVDTVLPLSERLVAAVKRREECRYAYDCALTAWQQADRYVDELLNEVANG